MSDVSIDKREKLFLIVAISLVISVISVSITLFYLYQTLYEEYKIRIAETVRNQVTLISSMTIQHINNSETSDSSSLNELLIADVIDHVQNAHNNDQNTQFPIEYSLFKIEHDKRITFLNNTSDKNPLNFSEVNINDFFSDVEQFESGEKIEPFTVTDQQGINFIAAYRYIPELGIGLLAYINTDYLKQPFIKTLKIVLFLTFILVILGSFLFAQFDRPKIDALDALDDPGNKYSSIFKYASDMMFLLDSEYNIIEANDSACKKYQYKSSELKNKKFVELVHPKHRKCFENTLYVTQNSDDAKLLSEHQTSNKKIFPVEIHITPITITNNKAVVVSVRDITNRIHEQKAKMKLESQLAQSEKLASIGQLAAGVAHEINNPIGFIYSNLNTMQKYLNKISKLLKNDEISKNGFIKESKDIFEDFNDAVSESIEGAERVKKIVADLKSFSRSDNNEFKFHDINEGIESTLNIVWNQIKYHCKVEKDLKSLPHAYCVGSQINQVIMNLIANAGQAIEKNGIINIRSWADKDNIHISIKDNGKGIEKANLNKIYEPFFTTKEVGVGTGLGLSVVYDIIKKHNGDIKVSSEVGVGTEFMISFPHQSKEKVDDEQLLNPAQPQMISVDRFMSIK